MLGFKFDMFGRTAYGIHCWSCSSAFWCAEESSFPLRPRAARHPRERDAHAGDRRAEPRAPAQGLHHRRGDRRNRRRAAHPHHLHGVAGGALLRALGRRAGDPDPRRRRPALRRHHRRDHLHGGATSFSGLNPQYWYFWIGLLVAVVVLPNGIPRVCKFFHEEAKELRLARGGAGHRARAAARRALRADRAERRRQDHADEPDDRNAEAGFRADFPRRRGDHRPQARCARKLARTFQINTLSRS